MELQFYSRNSGVREVERVLKASDLNGSFSALLNTWSRFHLARERLHVLVPQLLDQESVVRSLRRTLTEAEADRNRVREVPGLTEQYNTERDALYELQRAVTGLKAIEPVAFPGWLKTFLQEAFQG